MPHSSLVIHKSLYFDEKSVFCLQIGIMDEIERTLLVKQEVFIYKIPPRTSAKGYRGKIDTCAVPPQAVRHLKKGNNFYFWHVLNN